MASATPFFGGRKCPETYVSSFRTGETHHAGLPAGTLRAGGAGAAVLAGRALWGGGDISVG